MSSDMPFLEEHHVDLFLMQCTTSSDQPRVANTTHMQCMESCVARRLGS